MIALYISIYLLGCVVSALALRRTLAVNNGGITKDEIAFPITITAMSWLGALLAGSALSLYLFSRSGACGVIVKFFNGGDK
jgi:hypothetical protein